MKTEKVKVSGLARRMWGYKSLASSNVGKLLENYKLSLDRGRRFIFDAHSGIFATVNIRPEIYPLAGQDIQAMHGRVGFVYHGWVQYHADGAWLTDWDKDFFLFYEPFAEEVIVFPARSAELRIFHPWWRKGTAVVHYELFTANGVKKGRGFKVRGNQLTAYQDEAFCWKTTTECMWHYFEPLHFVYTRVPTVEELIEMSK